MWHEDPTSDMHLTEINNAIENIMKMLPKYFSRVHKNKMCLLAENVMLDKILLPQFRFINQEITGENSKAPTQKQAEYTTQICHNVKKLMLHYFKI